VSAGPSTSRSAAVGSTPAGFSTATTGGGAPGAWKVQEEEGAPSGRKVLRQTSADDTRGRFPVCVFDGLAARDVDLSVRFRPISGEVDQAAGLVWRYQDRDNYYLVRANALEQNVVLYKVAGPSGPGRRRNARHADQRRRHEARTASR
jgi:hypothetical protein